MMDAEPTKEHAWLQKLVGEWDSEADCAAENGEPMKSKGTETVRSMGGLWIVGEGQGLMPDGDPATMLLTVGYDPQKKRFIGSWAGSMMTHMWIYEGELDEGQKVLTLNTTGPKFGGEPGATAAYQDIITVISDDHRTLTSRMQGDDGSWTQFMEAHYRRRK